MTTNRWNPWRALRDRPRTLLFWQELSWRGGVVEVYPGGREVIVLDPRLDRRERRAVLAHELIHLERSVPLIGTPAEVVRREEACVQREVVRRLVPPDELRALVAVRVAVEPVTVDIVADEFDVPADVAERAMLDLRANADHPPDW